MLEPILLPFPTHRLAQGGMTLDPFWWVPCASYGEVNAQEEKVVGYKLVVPTQRPLGR